MAFSDPLSRCMLKEVEEVDEEVGDGQCGSYGFVYSVKVDGLLRIAKKPHPAYVSGVSDTERNRVLSSFRNECGLLSKLRHPNIVQFIGVYYGRNSREDIALVMEKLEFDLAKYVSSDSDIQLCRKLSILRDVTYGLVYLHEYNPVIIHRDLTARNILLTKSYQAKIADVGVSKLMDTSAKKASSYTKAPGQPNHMPPEALMDKPIYTSKLDIFSFGHVCLHTIFGDYPKVSEVRITPDMLQKGTIQRMKRQASLDCIGCDHCLYPLITQCLLDDPSERPTTREVNSSVCSLAEGHSRDFRVEMKEVEITKGLSRKNEELSEILLQRDQQLVRLQNEATSKEQRLQVLQGGCFGLKEHMKMQSRVVLDLKEKLKAQTAEREHIEKKNLELKEELVRLREDFESARQSLKDLKEKNKGLLLGRSNPSSASNIGTEDSCSNPTCQAMQYQIIALREENEERKKIVTSLENTVSHLQQEKNTALEQCSLAKVEPDGGDEESGNNVRSQAMQQQIHVYALQEETEEKSRIITSLEKTVAHFQQERNAAMEQVLLAKAEAEIFKSDFEEERRDRMRAQGLLADFKDKKNYATIYQEQEAKLRQERDQAIQERNSLKRELSGAKAELSKHKDITAMKKVLEMHIADTEKISRDRDLYRQRARKVKPLEEEVLSSKKIIADLRSSIEVMVENEKVKQKELQRAVEQMKHGNSVVISLTSALDKARRSLSDAKLELQEFKKAKRNLDNQIKKLEKSIKKSGHQHPDEDEASFQHLFDDNLELKNHNMFLEGRIKDMEIEIKEHKKLMHDITIYKAVPKDPEEVSAQSAQRKNKMGSESSKKTSHDQFSSKPPQHQVMNRDVEEKRSSLASRSTSNQQQHIQQNSEYGRELGQHNPDKTWRPVIQSRNIPPIPPRQPIGPSCQIQGTYYSERSRDRRDHELFHEARQGADSIHSFGEFAVVPSPVVLAGTIGLESHSTWPVEKNERPLRAGANSTQADNLVNWGDSSHSGSSGYEGKSSIKHEQVMLKDLSAVDIITPDINEQEDKALSTILEAEDSNSALRDTSDTDSKSLYKSMATVHKPMDPNLICPICGKQFRVGEIQKYRAHVDNCV